MILDHVSNNLSTYLKENGNNRLLLGISGGVDSIVLLNILDKIKIKYSFNISLIHINYGMQRRSDNAEKLCHALASDYEIDIISKKVKLNKSNFESNARDARYNFFNDYSKKNNIDYILTAHHRNDQIETLHMKFLDNADWISFLGIRKKYGKIIRPMLDISKEDIYIYANKNKLKWIEDASNINLDYRRNNIRLKLLPEIIKDNPDHIELLMKKHYNALEKISVLKKEIKFLKSKYIIEKKSKYIILSNDITEISDNITFKLFYQDLCQNYFDYSIYSTKRHWEQFYLFILNSQTNSSSILDKEIKIYKDKRYHYLYIKEISLMKIKNKIKKNE